METTRAIAAQTRQRLAGTVPDGVVLDHTLHRANPPDAPHLVPAVERVIVRTGLDGARIWTGQAVLAHELVKIGALAG